MKLTNEEMRNYLGTWHQPSEMREVCEDIIDCLDSGAVKSELDFLGKARAAVSFAEQRGADAARLIFRNDQSDFELQFGARKEQWKFAQVDESAKGSERPVIERQFAAEQGFQGDSVTAWIKRAEAAPEAIRAQCVTKAEKHYSGWVRLLVYLDVQEYGIRQREIEASFPTATAPAKDAFSEVWVFWKERAYCVWKDGRLAIQLGLAPNNLEKVKTACTNSVIAFVSERFF